MTCLSQKDRHSSLTEVSRSHRQPIQFDSAIGRAPTVSVEFEMKTYS